MSNIDFPNNPSVDDTYTQKAGGSYYPIGNLG